MENSMKKGFTLIELLIVIAIIGALAAIVVVSLSGSTNKASNAVLQSNFGQAERIITSLPALNGVDENFCVAGATEGSAIRKIIDSFGTSGNFVASSGVITTGKYGYGIGGNSTKANTTLATAKSGCISGKVSGKGQAVVWLTGTDSDGTDVTYCVDSKGNSLKNIKTSAATMTTVAGTLLCSSVN
ncbi:MAG: prepilin-type N-terminal cleavage/methylation domain-containing protein [Candidatus Kaiserbacteria bacterium]|nr:prepilin-type N-terminal cleavage/methylation domain-containing protein [Candidatus Kaiserbacteria bacterium]